MVGNAFKINDKKFSDENKDKKADMEILIITPVYHRRLSTSQNWLENEGEGLHENKVPIFIHNETKYIIILISMQNYTIYNQIFRETKTIDDLPEEEKDFSYILTTREKKIVYKTSRPRFSPNYWNMYQLLQDDQPKATSAIEAQHLEFQVKPIFYKQIKNNSSFFHIGLQ